MIEFDFAVVLAQWPMLLRGLGLTVVLTVISAVLGALLGTTYAWARLHGSVILKRAVGGYVELVRNTPFIIQLFFIFFGLPSLGLRLSVEVACVLAMVFNLGAYACEIVRAGLQATPKGQLEDAMANFLARGFATCIGAHLASTGEPDHHRHAGLGGVRTNLSRRVVASGQPDLQPHLSQF